MCLRHIGRKWSIKDILSKYDIVRTLTKNIYRKCCKK